MNLIDAYRKIYESENKTSVYDDFIQNGIEAGLSDGVVKKVVNKLWGYNVKNIIFWSVLSNEFTVYVELKSGKSWDVTFTNTGGIKRRKLVSKEKQY